MNEYISNKIRILSFLLIVLVLYIHSSFHLDEISGMNLNNIVQLIISDKIARLAVPIFFMISGYLFFYSSKLDIYAITKKIKSRIQTLLIPYIIGCLFFVVFFVVIAAIPGTRSFMNSDISPLFKKPIVSIIISIFWNTDTGNGPLAFQLWFLRDLIIIVAISPVLFFLMQKLKWVLALLLFTLTYIHIAPSSLLSSLFWFSLGGILSFHKIDIGYYKTNWVILSASFYVLFSIIELCTGIIVPPILLKPIIITGIFSVWYGYDYIVSKPIAHVKEYHWLTVATGFSFFIYLYHEPTLNIVRKIIVFGLGKNEIGYLLSYLISPILFVFISVFLGIFLKKHLSKTYTFLTGGRI